MIIWLQIPSTNSRTINEWYQLVALSRGQVGVSCETPFGRYIDAEKWHIIRCLRMFLIQLLEIFRNGLKSLDIKWSDKLVAISQYIQMYVRTFYIIYSINC